MAFLFLSLLLLALYPSLFDGGFKPEFARAVTFFYHPAVVTNLTDFAYEVRLKLGALLAKNHPVEADFVIPVPDSGIPAAVGYSRASGIWTSCLFWP